MRKLFPFLIVTMVGCTVKVPAQRGLRVAVNAELRAVPPAEVHVQAQSEVQAEAQVEVQGEAQAEVYGEVQVEAQVEAQARPVETLVPLEGAEVVEFFGIPLDGAQDLIFVLDRSGSMNDPAPGPLSQVASNQQPGSMPRKIDVAQAELIDALGRLPVGTTMNVIFFNSELEAYAASLVPLEDAGRDGLAGFITGMEAYGPTALTPAMRTAFLMNARRIVLLSDGLGNIGGDAGVLLRDAREAIRGGVRVDTIGLGADQDVLLLRTLAQESGGLYQAL